MPVHPRPMTPISGPWVPSGSHLVRFSGQRETAAGAFWHLQHLSLGMLAFSVAGGPQLRGPCRPGCRTARVGGRGPADQEVQRFAGGGARFGGVDEQGLAGIGGHLQGLKRQSEVPDERVVDVLDPSVMGLHVVRGPADRNSSLRADSSPTRSDRCRS